MKNDNEPRSLYFFSHNKTPLLVVWFTYPQHAHALFFFSNHTHAVEENKNEIGSTKLGHIKGTMQCIHCLQHLYNLRGMFPKKDPDNLTKKST